MGRASLLQERCLRSLKYGTGAYFFLNLLTSTNFAPNLSSKMTAIPLSTAEAVLRCRFGRGVSIKFTEVISYSVREKVTVSSQSIAFNH